MLEYYQPANTDFTAVFSNHSVAVHLSGCIDLYQRCEGHSVRTQMRRGNITINPAGTQKLFQHAGGGDFLLVHISPSLLSRVSRDLWDARGQRPELIHRFTTTDPDLEFLVHKLWREYQVDDVGSGIYAETLGAQLAIHLLRGYSTLTGVAPRDLATARLQPAQLRAATEYIEENLSADLAVSDVANAVLLSSSHFAHAFRNSAGVPPHQYVVQRRIARAKVLLRETKLPISSVAARAGFSTHAHFCVIFQRLTGATPRAFRRLK
jgi:AraC family transcriptional regulator